MSAGTWPGACRGQSPNSSAISSARAEAASDIYLGWTKGVDVRRHFYWRQLRDMKDSAVVEALIPFGLTYYARICG